MSDEIYEDEELDSNNSDAGDNGGDLKSLRRAASGKKKMEAELNATKRELAFAKAGLPMNDPRMNYFIKGYEGDMTAEAIFEAASEAGFIQVQEAPKDNAVNAAAAAQHRVMAASTGVGYEGMSDDAAMAQLEAAMEEGGIDAMLDVARQFGIPTHIDG